MHSIVVVKSGMPNETRECYGARYAKCAARLVQQGVICRPWSLHLALFGPLVNRLTALDYILLLPSPPLALSQSSSGRSRAASFGDSVEHDGVCAAT